MRRFLLFAGSLYYPSGGWEDFVASYDTLLDATVGAAKLDADRYVYMWWQIVDTETMKVVSEHRNNGG